MLRGAALATVSLALLDIAPDQVSHEIEQLYYRLQQPLELAGSDIAVQLSCGVSLAPQDAHSGEELLRHAEFALEAARSGNSSSIEYYASEQNAAARERHQLAAALPVALGRGELEVHFQPFVDIVSGDIVGAEALVRWRHRKKAGYRQTSSSRWPRRLGRSMRSVVSCWKSLSAAR